MGAGSEWAVRCILFVAWSASHNAYSEAFTFISRPPSSTAGVAAAAGGAAAPSSSTSQHRPPSVARPPSPQHGPWRISNGLYASTSGRYIEVLGSRQRRVAASSCCDDGPGPVASSLENSRGSRRERSAVGPLFAEDQGWLDALKGVADEPALPLGPTKKKVGERRWMCTQRDMNIDRDLSPSQLHTYIQKAPHRRTSPTCCLYCCMI